MEKSIWTTEYGVLLRMLKDARRAAGFTQIQLAQELQLTQSLWSKMERGDCRIDVIQLRRICLILGVSFPEFIQSLEDEIAGDSKGFRSKKK